MAEVHSRKNTQANQAAQAIESAKKERIKKTAAAEAEENSAVSKALSTHSSNVVA